MIKARVLAVLSASGVRLPDLEVKTGISRYTWANLKNPAKAREIKAAEIEAVVALWPCFALWIVSGQTAPAAGQIAPDLKEPAPCN